MKLVALRIMPARHKSQAGVSLLVVMIAVMLSMLLVLGGSRIAILNESLVSNDTDYQRAFEAAQALLSDAELDLLGRGPDGGACVGGACRTTASPVFFPRDEAEYQDLDDTLRAVAIGGIPPCRNGICLDLGDQTSGDTATSFWNNPGGVAPTWNNTRTLATFTAAESGFNRRGATYGQYTGAVFAPNSGNPLLNPATPRAWYWIEVLRYNPAGGNNNPPAGSPNFSNSWAPPTSEPFVYRVTAVAQGLKAGSMAVVQSYIVPDPSRRAPL